MAMQEILSARFTAAAAYSAGTPVYASAAGVATRATAGHLDNQLGVLTSDVAIGEECQIAKLGNTAVITASAANVGEWAVADSGKVVAYTNTEIGGLTSGRVYTLLGQFTSAASGADEIAFVDISLSTTMIS